MKKQLVPTLASKMNQVLNSQYPGVKGMAILKENTILYESYAEGTDKHTPHNVASVTKSVMSTLVGIAIDKGYIQDVKQPVLQYFEDYIATSNNDFRQVDTTNRKNITIEHLLTMTAHFAFALKSIESRPFEPLDRLRRQRDWVAFILKMMGEGRGRQNVPLGTFQYSTPAPHLLSAILNKTTGMSTLAFANKYLFEPIGMRTIEDKPMKAYDVDHTFGKKIDGWAKDPQGNHTGGWGLTLSTEDMLRLGQLYLNKGVYNGAQILSEEWVKATIEPKSKDYGYLWWLHQEQNIKAYAALGFGGNGVYVVPALKLVVAVTAELKYVKQSPWSLLYDHTIPYLQELP